MRDLLPCPFCGCDKLEIADESNDSWILCEDCGARSGLYSEYESAKNSWNKRSLPPGVTGYLTIHPEVLKGWEEDID